MCSRYPIIGKEERATAIGVPWGKLYRRDLLDKYELRFDKDAEKNKLGLHDKYRSGWRV